MSFSIAFLDEPLAYPFDDETCPGAYGLLELGDYQEKFLSGLYLWTKRDYEMQWQKALVTLLNGGDKAALITEYLGPSATRLRWWPMYRLDRVVHFQEQILFFDQLVEPFRLDREFAYLAEYRSANEKGMIISEWPVSLSDLKAFARR